MARNRPAGYHPAVLAVTWFAGGVLAVSVGYGAVRLVGDQVAQRSAAPLSQRAVAVQVAELGPTSGPAPVAETSAPPTAASTIGSAGTGRGGDDGTPGDGGAGGAGTGPTPTATARARSFVLVGGRIVVSCTGPRIALGFAYPFDGFHDEIQVSRDRHSLEARFESSDHDSHLTVTCRDGVPHAMVGEGDEEPHEQ